MTELGMRLREPVPAYLIRWATLISVDSPHSHTLLYTAEGRPLGKGLRRAVSLVRDRTGAIETILGRYEQAEV